MDALEFSTAPIPTSGVVAYHLSMDPSRPDEFALTDEERVEFLDRYLDGLTVDSKGVVRTRASR